MSVRLTIKARGEPGAADKAEVVVLNDDVITIGRGELCEVRLLQQAVSHEHAQISRDDTLFFVQDLNSRFGTTINGTKLNKGEKHLLCNGDTIAIAQYDVVFDRVAQIEEGEERTGHTQFISANVVRNVMKGVTNGDQPYLRVMNGPKEGQKVMIGAAQEYIVGRDEAADIQLEDDLVSRRHVKIRRDWAGVSVEDLGSRNGIKVNKKKVKRVTLKDRDEVQIGTVKMLFIDPAEIRAPIVMPASDEDEATNALADEPPPDPEEEPNVQVSSELNQAVEPEPEPEASAEDQAPAEDEPPADPEQPEFDEQNQTADEGEGELDGEAKAGLIDFKNKQNLIVLGIVAFFAIIGLVILVLLIAGL